MKKLVANNRLLIVDDDDGPRESLNLIFQDDYEVHAVSSGERAISLSKQDPFSIVVVDLRMKGLSGIDTLKELKRIYPFTEVIILTAFETLETARLAISNGASDYLSKPFDIDQIRRTVAKSRDRFTFLTRQDLLLREDVTRAKEDFLALLSHELLTPLNGVMGFSDLLMETNLTHEQREMLGNMQSCSLNLYHKISDILNFAQATFDNQPVPEELFNPATLLLKIGAGHRSPDGDPKIDFDIPVDIPPFVYGPEHEIKAILSRLFDNSVKFTRTGRILLSLSFNFVSSDTYRLKFRIQDTGIGIAEDDIAKRQIFDPFQQLDSSMTRNFGGLGLGLAYCKRLCERIDGELKSESVPQKGSIFVFSVFVKPCSSEAK